MHGGARSMRGEKHVTYTQSIEKVILSHLKQITGEYVDLNSGAIHREYGGYPGKKHHMPQCCQAMYNIMNNDDSIISSPPQGKGTSLIIRYYKKNHMD